MKITVWLDPEEHAFVKEQEAGFIRGLVHEKMSWEKGNAACFAGLTPEQAKREQELLPLGGNKPSPILQAMKVHGVQRGVEGIGDLCPECGARYKNLRLLGPVCYNESCPRYKQKEEK